LELLHDESAAKYEETLGVPPPEDWTTEQITEAMDKKNEKEDRTLIEVHKASGPKSQTAQRTRRYGHRHGKKPAKPGREAKRKELRKEAA
jgi:hypothetical protein